MLFAVPVNRRRCAIEYQSLRASPASVSIVSSAAYAALQIDVLISYEHPVD
jgi:hypothetical protein